MQGFFRLEILISFDRSSREIQAVYIYPDKGKIFTIKGGPEMHKQLFTRRLAEP